MPVHLYNFPLTSQLQVLDNLRTIHGRGVLEPVSDTGKRRWVKRLWLTATSTEQLLQECAGSQMHPRCLAKRRCRPCCCNMETGYRRFNCISCAKMDGWLWVAAVDKVVSQVFAFVSLEAYFPHQFRKH